MFFLQHSGSGTGLGMRVYVQHTGLYPAAAAGYGGETQMMLYVCFYTAVQLMRVLKTKAVYIFTEYKGVF